MGKKVRLKLIFSIIYCGIFCLSKVVGQQDPQYTQYMFNTMSVNPAYTGSKGHKVLNFLMRSQWVGVEGAPSTQTFSYDSPIGYSGLGLGVNLVNDVIGPAREVYFDVNSSYKVRMSEEANLAFGLRLGGRFFSVDWSKGIYRDQADNQFSENISKMLPTIGLGMYYYTDKYYFGLSVPNILRTEHYDDVSNGGEVSEERLHFFLIAGYVFDLNQNIKFKPAFLTKVVAGAPLSIDLSANFLFNEKFRAGVSWRWDDSISALLGFQVSETFQIGYAYDLTTSNYSNYNSGSHELMLRYELFKKGVITSPRFF
ncbi:type IX secretion system membrane protein, PorP/SprF family [Tenacibaculum sp. MAR_2009_124]|uniref:PorP/SprF family type IX secretion system membrane protein n=1 Tax=Tenacibaculum sp. MAR_2009_124 TaxID=1250059 RepID=UPI00089CD580|nr:type IX secretion system membrane protein PorP/SprF [Tenacibaculum sp. MAR_2009_124]SEC81161.1 type IX secretion system membrane protein, PorP/SprF family [Tenacibaculum sp. MAR_2009_124]